MLQAEQRAIGLIERSRDAEDAVRMAEILSQTCPDTKRRFWMDVLDWVEDKVAVPIDDDPEWAIEMEIDRQRDELFDPDSDSYEGPPSVHDDGREWPQAENE